MKRYAFFQCDLGVGGIQKSIINLLRNLDYSRVRVDLFLSEKNDFWDISFPAGVTVHYLRPVPRILSFLPYEIAAKFIRFDFSDYPMYDLAVDFNSYQFSCAKGALTIPAEKRVMWIHNDVEKKLAEEWKYRILWYNFRGKFKHYDGFVPVSEGLIEPFQKMSGQKDKTYTVIQNYIDTEEIHKKMTEPVENFNVDPDYFNLVAVGKLCHQKGYDLMLPIVAKALQQRKDLRLYIMGDGPEKESLLQLGEDLGIADHVIFLGNRENPFAIMSQMDAFISTSRYEGQPLNIMEAKAVGLPLFCAKNLEKYTEDLCGYEDLTDALASAVRQPKKPDNLIGYNQKILQSVLMLG